MVFREASKMSVDLPIGWFEPTVIPPVDPTDKDCSINVLAMDECGQLDIVYYWRRYNKHWRYAMHCDCCATFYLERVIGWTFLPAISEQDKEQIIQAYKARLNNDDKKS